MVAGGGPKSPCLLMYFECLAWTSLGSPMKSTLLRLVDVSSTCCSHRQIWSVIWTSVLLLLLQNAGVRLYNRAGRQQGWTSICDLVCFKNPPKQKTSPKWQQLNNCDVSKVGRCSLVDLMSFLVYLTWFYYHSRHGSLSWRSRYVAATSRRHTQANMQNIYLSISTEHDKFPQRVAKIKTTKTCRSWEHDMSDSHGGQAWAGATWTWPPRRHPNTQQKAQQSKTGKNNSVRDAHGLILYVHWGHV